MRERAKPSGGYYVYKRTRGKLERWVVEHRPGMGMPREYRVFLTRTEAEGFKQKQLAESPPTTNSSLVAAPLLEQCWALYKHNATLRMRAGTMETYDSVMSIHVLPRLGKMPINEITPTKVKEVIDEMLHEGVSPYTTRNAIGTLRSVLAEFVEPMGPLRTNPAAIQRGWIRMPIQRPKSLTKSQVQAFYEAAKMERYWPLIVFLLQTGVRLGEALALRWEDVDLEAKTAVIQRTVRLGHLTPPKTRFGVRRVDLSKTVVDILRVEAQKARGALVFHGEDGPDRYVNARHLHHVFQRISRRAGIAPPVHPHMLRHTWATQMLQGGSPLQYVSRALGHHSTAFTAGVYATASPDSRHADVDRLANVMEGSDELVELEEPAEGGGGAGGAGLSPVR